MFDWFGSRDYKMPKTTVPYIETPTAEEVQYSIGTTSENRIALRIGYTTLTMNRKGCNDLIEQLEVFMKQLPNEVEIETDFVDK